MNQQHQITTKWYREHPLVADKTWASWKIFIASFVLFSISLQIGTYWGNLYPSSSQRGQKPQAAHYRPLMVVDYEFSSGGIRTDREVELYAKAFVDDYAFKKTLFTSKYLL